MIGGDALNKTNVIDSLSYRSFGSASQVVYGNDRQRNTSHKIPNPLRSGYANEKALPPGVDLFGGNQGKPSENDALLVVDCLLTQDTPKAEGDAFPGNLTIDAVDD